MRRGWSAVSGWSLLRWAPPLLVLTALLLAWWLAALRLQTQERQLVEQAHLQQAGLTAVIHGHWVQLSEKGRLMAVAASELLEGSASEADLARHRLRQMLAADPALVHYVVLDAQMARIDASATPFDTAALQRQLHAAAPQLTTPPGAAGAPAVHVLAPVVTELGPSARQTLVPLLFPIPPMSGRTEGGFLLLAMDADYFLGLYRDTSLRHGSSLWLLSGEGSLLAVLADDGAAQPPMRAGQALSLQQLVQHGGERGHGSAAWPLQPGARATPHLVNWQRHAGMPVTVVASLDLAQLLAEEHGRHQRMWLLLAGITVVSLLVTLALARALGRQHSLFQALSLANDQNQRLIDQLEHEKARALELASSDPLTGLHNRRMFNELVTSHLALARRSPKHYALLYLDLDRFKPINDSLGHHVGDQLLQAVAARLRALVRSSDIIGRLGGDEFAVLVTAMEQLGDMDQLATKLVGSLSLPYELQEGDESHRLQISPSIGIAFFPRDGHDVATLARHADAAMYASKRAGRGRFTYYDAALNPADGRSWQLERELAHAIASDQLVLHFQPKVRLEDCRIEGFEALVRWQHPEFGLVFPGDFIALAEKTGLIVELGDWVIRACCRQAAHWRQQGVEGVPIAFNVSPLQLRDTAFPSRMATYLQEYGVRASDLEVEITESCLVEPVDLAARVLSQLQGMGMRIGLDDFGTGFSSLSQIRHLPIDTLKLDRSFVDDIRSSPEAGVLVTSIITLAHNLKMRVVAEGVELRDQLVYLKTAGCDVAQGYILSRPVPAEDTQRLLRQSVLEPA